MKDLSNYLDWVNTTQAREILECGKTKIFELIKYQKISSRKVGRLRYVPKSELRLLLQVKENKKNGSKEKR